ncbi:MAG TPA: M1 family metallopeptidase [Candidatus Saccharimonas sp.]|jgi:aminopeptidase N|nr:M1 family metallopeptidase [Candidatus Saccharimonas sp.]
MQSVKHLLDEYIPEAYDLSLTLSPRDHSVSGHVVIQGTSTNGLLVLHSKDLAIDTVRVNDQPANHQFGNDDLLEIIGDYSPGAYTITIDYHFVATEHAHGMYYSRYTHDGVDKYMYATQFESHAAREVLPCIDEPAAKATFDLSITTDANLVTLSNMPVLEANTTGDQQTTRFATSPRMSSYLLAFTVGELHARHGTSARGVDVSVWATTAQPLESLDFALQEAITYLDFYESYFGVDYPLPKCDHLAIPDFGGGAAAMENWGLITYRQDYLLAPPAQTSLETKQHIAKTIAHEISHQWFGNLVTMQWWNDLWLNESFANIMEYMALDAAHPDWQPWLDFSTYESVIALRRDAIDGVQSVQIDVNHPDEISTIFDGAIVYAKGSRLIRMAHDYIGDVAFRRGLTAYFTQHAYGNTVADDLWQAFETASGKDVTSLMHVWLSQPGYPVVHLERTADKVSLTQQQFFIGEHSESSRVWPIPLDAATPSLPALLTTPTATYDIAPGDSAQLNIHDSSHFISHYDESTLQSLLQLVKDGTMSPVGKIQLLHEQTLLARAGIVSSASLITLLDVYRNETDAYLWDIMSVAIGELKKFVENNDDAEQQLRRFVGSLARPLYGQLGWDTVEQEASNTTKLRATIIGCMLYSEDTDAIARAISLYRSQSIDSIDPELRALIIGTVVRHDHAADDIATLVELYTTTNNPELQQDICSALTSSRDDETLKKLIELLTQTKTIRLQDTISWYVSLLRNRHSRSAAWQWMRDQWPWIIKNFADEKSYDRFPQYSANSLMSRQQLQEYIDFFSPMSDIALQRAITMGVRDLTARVELIEHDEPAVVAALLQMKKVD